MRLQRWKSLNTKERVGNKVASGVSITSEIPDFFTHCRWNKIEQLYSALQAVQEGAIKYKLYHITLHLPTEPFGYNCTPVGGAGAAAAALLFLRRPRELYSSPTEECMDYE